MSSAKDKNARREVERVLIAPIIDTRLDAVAIGAALRAARKANGLSVAKTSQLVSASPATIKRWESGQGLPQKADLFEYFSILSVSETVASELLVNLNERVDKLERPGRLLQRVLRSKRRRAGLTLQEVSLVTGLSVASLQRYETGDRLPDEANLARIIQAVGASQEETRALTQMLADPQDQPASADQFVPSFSGSSDFPHLKVFDFLESLWHQPIVSANDLQNLLKGLIYLGDQQAVIEVSSLLKKKVQVSDWTALDRFQIGTTLALSQSTRASFRQSQFVKWCALADTLPASDERDVGLLNLVRIGTTKSEFETAQNYLDTLQTRAGSIGNAALDFLVQLNSITLGFEMRPQRGALDQLTKLASTTIGPFQAYNVSVAMVYVSEKLQERALTVESMSACQNFESLYGLGSPLVRKISNNHELR